LNQPHRNVRMVPAAKVSEWLVWLGQRSTQDPRDTEVRRLSNRLYEFCQRAGAPDSALAARGMPTATTAKGTGGVPGFDWTTGEIPFAPRPGFGGKEIERLFTRVVAVTHIRE
jgi:hypothetical protein